MEELLQRIPLGRLTLGGICMYQATYILMKNKLPGSNPIANTIIADKNGPSDGRMRYSREARRWQPRLRIALCLEEDPFWARAGLTGNMGRCNCFL